MTVADIRNIVTDSNVEIIEISDTMIYYAEEKNEEGHNSLFILEYNRITRSERVIANYFLNNPAFVQHYFSFPDMIIVVMENGSGVVWVMRLEKATGRERNMAQIHFVGDYSSCTALDESHVVFFTVENETDHELFRTYQKLTGLNKVVYLYDLEQEKYFYIKDKRACSLGAENLVTYDVDGEKQLLILQPYGDEQEKERCYRNARWLGDNVSDRVWKCPLIDFFVAVKSGENKLPLGLCLSAGTDGLVRYAGMDSRNLYFRIKYYPTNDQRICAVEKRSGKKSVVAALNLGPDEQDAHFVIDTSAARIYRVREMEDGLCIDGVLNSSIHTKYSHELGEFVSCVEDRILIARYVTSDENGPFEISSIYDSQTGEQKSFDGRCAVKGNTVVLY